MAIFINIPSYFVSKFQKSKSIVIAILYLIHVILRKILLYQQMKEQKLKWKSQGNRQILRYAYGQIIITQQKPKLEDGYLITSDPFSKEGHLNIHSSQQNKIFDTLDQILTHMTSSRLNKSSKVYIKGGGMLLDIAGFAAQIYMRGINDVTYLPTTLLATVDAAVGGKTGLNFKTMKNFVGNTKNYTKILIYLPFLQTLDQREFFNGMGEVIKMAAVYDSQFFQYLTTLSKKDLYLSDSEQLSQTEKKQRKKTIYENLTKIVKQCVMFKATVTLQDLTQKKARKWLNFGHTLSHAFELSPYNTYKHGQCVSIGMVKAAELAYKYGYLKKKSDIAKLKQTAHRFGLPTQIPKYYNRKQMMQLVMKDKKKTTNENNTQFVLISQLGKRLEQAVKIPNDELYTFITQSIQIKYKRGINKNRQKQILCSKQKRFCQIFEKAVIQNQGKQILNAQINNLADLFELFAMNLLKQKKIIISNINSFKNTNSNQYDLLIKNLFKIPGLKIGVYPNKLELFYSSNTSQNQIIFEAGQNQQISMGFTIISVILYQSHQQKCILDNKDKLENNCQQFVEFIKEKGVSFSPIQYSETEYHLPYKKYEHKNKFLIIESNLHDNLQDIQALANSLKLNVIEFTNKILPQSQTLKGFSQLVNQKGSNHLIVIDKTLANNRDIQIILQNNYSIYLTQQKSIQKSSARFAKHVINKCFSNKKQYYQKEFNALSGFFQLQNQTIPQNNGLILLEDNLEIYSNVKQYQFCNQFSAVEILADQAIGAYLNQGLSVNSSIDKFRKAFSEFKMHNNNVPIILSMASIYQTLENHDKFQTIMSQIAKIPSHWLAMPISHRINFDYDFNKIIWTYKGSQQGMIQLLCSRPYGLKRWYMTPFSASSRNIFETMKKNTDMSIFLGDYLSQINNRYQMVGRKCNKSTGIPNLDLIQTLRKISKMIK